MLKNAYFIAKSVSIEPILQNGYQVVEEPEETAREFLASTGAWRGRAPADLLTRVDFEDLAPRGAISPIWTHFHLRVAKAVRFWKNI